MKHIVQNNLITISPAKLYGGNGTFYSTYTLNKLISDRLRCVIWAIEANQIRKSSLFTEAKKAR